MKLSRRIERALVKARRTLDRLEALRRADRLSPQAFLDATPAIRDYLALVERELAHNAGAARAYAADQAAILARTRSLAESVGLGRVWDETMGGPAGASDPR